MKDKDIKYINNSNPLVFSGSNPEITEPIFVGAHRDILITAVTVATGGGLTQSTIKVLGSTQETPPDFTQASSPTNSYAPITLADYSLANTYYAGATGLVQTNSGTKILELNTNLLTWICFTKVRLAGLGSGIDTDILLTLTNAQ